MNFIIFLYNALSFVPVRTQLNLESFLFPSIIGQNPWFLYKYFILKAWLWHLSKTLNSTKLL